MLKQMEEHAALVRAALIDTSGNPGLTMSAMRVNGLLFKNGEINRPRIMAIIKHNPMDLLNMPGIGRGTYFDILRMMLETV